MKGINSNKNNNRTMDKRLLSLLFVVFLLTSVSAIYGGESVTLGFEFEPVICEVSNNLTYKIVQKDVLVEIPINYVGNITITASCFGGEYEGQKVVYRGGGSRTKYIYENITEYVDKIVEVEKVVEVEVPGEDNIIEKIIEVTPKRNNANIVIGVLLVSLLLSLLWNFKKDDKIEEIHNDSYKGGEK